jgi:hypothetical protein
MRELHAWHRRTFFDFDKHLNQLEKDYIAACVELMDAREHKVDHNLFYSTVSYSHRVRGDKVNSSRVAYGSLRHRDRLRQPMERILRSRGISPEVMGNLPDAFGLGWDIEAGHLKVYIHLRSLAGIEDREAARLVRKVGETKVHDFGLVSYTFEGPRLSERKVYVALREPRPAQVRDYPFRDLITHTNFMITDRRGIVPQVDLKSGELDGKRYLNAAGRKVCEAYQRAMGRELTARDASVDTLAYQGPDELTLYF